METQTFSRKALSALVIIVLFSYQSMSAQQMQITEAEDIVPTHSVIFILSTLFFIVGFILLIRLKFREDAKEKKEEEKESNTISYITKHRHHHPKHYGHRHQYHH